MSDVYLALPGTPDRLLGHVHDDGKVYRSQTGPDDQVGRVDLATGAIYEQRFGPDKKVGHVDLSSGKVYSSRFGPDEHIGQVNDDGRMYCHQTLAADDYVGKVDEFHGYAHAAGGLILLVLPALEAELPAGPQQEAPMD